MQPQQFIDESQSARSGPLSPTPSHPSLVIGYHISLHHERCLLTVLTVIHTAMLAVSLAVGGGALWGYVEVGGKQLFAVACFSAIPVLASAVSIVGVGRSREDLGKKDQMILKVQEVVGEDVLQLGFCLTLYAFAGFVVLGTACFIYQSQVAASLEAEAAAPGVWAVRHPAYTLSSLILFSRSLYSLIGSGCLLYANLCFIGFCVVTRLAVDNETSHVVVQVVDSARVFVGLFLGFAAEFTYRVSEEVMWAGFPAAILRISLTLAVVSVLLSLYGFFAGKSETLSRVRLYTLFTFVFGCALVLVLLQSWPAYSAFQERISDHCLDLMELIDSDYLTYLGCPAKYTSFAESLSALHCPKSQTRRFWERSVGETRVYGLWFGCLDPSCCGLMTSTTSIVADYIAAALISLLALTLMSIIAGCGLLTKLKTRGPALFHNADSKIGAVIILGLIVGPGAMYAGLPLHPVAKPDLEPNVVVDGGSNLGIGMGKGDRLCVSLPLIDISSEMLACHCTNSSLSLQLTSSSGQFLSPPALNVTQSHSPSVLLLSSPSAPCLTAALNSTLLCDFCYNTESTVTMQLTRLEQKGDTLTEVVL